VPDALAHLPGALRAQGGGGLRDLHRRRRQPGALRGRAHGHLRELPAKLHARHEYLRGRLQPARPAEVRRLRRQRRQSRGLPDPGRRGTQELPGGLRFGAGGHCGSFRREACDKRAKEAYQACIDSGRTPEECAEKSQAVLLECLRTCGINVPPTATPTCVQNCETRAKEVYKACVEQGGTPDECEIKYKEFLDECLRRCSNAVPIPTATPTCEGKCELRYKEFLQACLASGRDPAECEAKAKAELQACLTLCRPSPEPTPTCQQNCERKAKAVLDACLAAGTDPALCQAKYQAALAECLPTCTPFSRPTRTPTATATATDLPLTCQQACERKAKAVLDECLASGLGEEECKAKAEAVLTECSATCPPTCEQTCRDKAAAVREACLAAGGTPEDCEKQALATLQECLQGCSTVGNLCLARCQALGERVFAECTATGASAEACREKQKQAVADCVALNCKP
jgi:hypothetical protein